MNTDDFDTKTPGVFEQTAPTDSEKIGEKYGTQHDRKDMNRLGKLQQLRVRYVFRSSWRRQLTAISPSSQRNFRFLSILGYALILGCTWEYALLGTLFSLPNGGPGGAIWMYLIVAFFFYFVMLSMAEMTSMAPTCGGQYHWVSEFAPRQHQKILSFLVGSSDNSQSHSSQANQESQQDGSLSSHGSPAWL